MEHGMKEIFSILNSSNLGSIYNRLGYSTAPCCPGSERTQRNIADEIHHITILGMLGSIKSSGTRHFTFKLNYDDNIVGGVTDAVYDCLNREMVCRKRFDSP